VTSPWSKNEQAKPSYARQLVSRCEALAASYIGALSAFCLQCPSLLVYKLMFVIGYMPQTSMYTPVSAGPFTPTQQQTAGFAAPAAGSYIGTSTPSANLSSGFTS